MKMWLSSALAALAAETYTVCWRGGITDTAFKKWYDNDYHFVHSCQDTHDEDVLHYIFQKDDSDEPPGSCGMCGINLTGEYDSPFPNEQQIDIRVAPRTRDILEDPATKREWSLGTRVEEENVL